MRIAPTLLLLAAAVTSSGATLWDNGAATSDTNRCNSGPGRCSGSGTWTALDDFQLTGQSNITGFTFNSYFYAGSAADYTSTSWSIWSGNPYSGGLVVASGSAVAALSAGAASSTLFAVTGLSVDLGPGTYYLGMSNVSQNGATSVASSAGSSLPGWLQTDSASNNFTNTGNTAFTIQGDVTGVPEPTTVSMFAIGAVAIFAGRRAAKR